MENEYPGYFKVMSNYVNPIKVMSYDYNGEWSEYADSVSPIKLDNK